jgi:sodium-independent sulfate anion transporter 11
VSFGVGVWSLILGLLNFGALFNFISLPMTLGFTVGISIPVLVTQIPLLLGEPPVGPIFILRIPQIIQQLPQVTPAAIAIAAASIVLLVFLQFVAKKWGHKSVALLHICNARNTIVMGLFTLISFFINKDLQQPIWKVLGPIKTEIPTPQLPIMILVQNLLLPSMTLALTVALEHVVLAKSFARVNEYKSNDSQEMVYLGVINIITSFFGGMPVGGGDPARPAVLSGSQVKSPLTGILTSVVVILAMNFGSRAFEWIPIPTIAAVITVAIANQILPMDWTSKWWKISFVDFLGFFMTFNVGLVTTGEMGLGLGFAIMIFYTLFRAMFSRPTALVSSDLESRYNGMNPPWWHKGDRIPAGTQVIKLETDVMFANAERIRRHVVDTVFIHLSGTSIRYTSTKERAWNYRRDKRIQRLRRKAKISDADEFAPRLRILILDLSSTSFVDGTGMHAFEDIKAELRSYGGEQVEFRFVGVSKALQKRFERAGWNLVSPYEEYPVVTVEGEEEPIMDLLFEHLPHAIEYEAQTGMKGRNSKYSYAEDDIEYSEKQFTQ